LVCYTEKRIGCCGICKKGICVDCWRSIEKSKRREGVPCPWCRATMLPLVDVLIEKFKEFST